MGIKSHFLLAAAVVISSPIQTSYGEMLPVPSISGETGSVRAISARGMVQGGVGVVGSGQFFRTSGLLSSNVTSTQWEGQIGASYGLLNVLEAFFTESNAYQTIDTGSTQKGAYALGDLTFGVKYGVPLSPLLSIGADVSARFLSKVGTWGYETSATSWGGKALLSAFPPHLPMRIHLNLGYWNDNSSAFYNDITSPIYRYASQLGPSRMLGTLGFEFPVLDGVLIPLLEYSTEIASGVDFRRDPNRITPGIRVIPRPSISVTMGIDTSLTSSGTTSTGQKVSLQPPWNIIVAASYIYIPKTKQLPPIQSPPSLKGVEKKGAILVLEKGRIELTEPILFFEYDQTRIMPESYWLLDSVAEIMKDHPDLKIRIEGHTDNIGGERYNQLLSQGRTDSVRNYLLSRGIPFDRIESVGYGSSRPITDNATPDGRARNRRVEFIIVSHGAQP